MHDHNVAAVGVALEVERHLLVAGEVPQLRLVRLAEDEQFGVGPQEPDQSRVRRTGGADGREPDQGVGLEALLDMRPELGREVDGGHQVVSP